MVDPKRILLDLQEELNGELLSETVEIRGRKFEMQLLNDEESSWVYGMINLRSDLALALDARRSTLAVGIRSIDGVSVAELYADDWKALEDKDEDEEDGGKKKEKKKGLSKAQRELIAEHGSKEFCFSHFFLDNFLKKVPPGFINELHEKWQALELRRENVQGELKNSLGEDSETEEKPSLTESSQDGEN